MSGKNISCGIFVHVCYHFLRHRLQPYRVDYTVDAQYWCMISTAAANIYFLLSWFTVYTL